MHDGRVHGPPNPIPNAWRLFVDEGGHQQPDFLIVDRFQIFHSALQGECPRIEKQFPTSKAEYLFKGDPSCQTTISRLPGAFIIQQEPGMQDAPNWRSGRIVCFDT